MADAADLDPWFAALSRKKETAVTKWAFPLATPRRTSGNEL